MTLDVLKKVKDHLDRNESIRTLALTPEERETLKPYPLLTAKKCLYVANVSENDLCDTWHPEEQLGEHGL